MLTTLLFALGLKSVLKIESNAREFNGLNGLVFLPTLLSCSSRFLRAL